MSNNSKGLSINLFFLTVIFVIGTAFCAHAGNPIIDMVLEKAKDELVERLGNEGYSNAAYVIGNMDSAKWEKYATQLRAGEYDKVIAQLLEEQKQAVLNDLYAKAKGYAKEYASDKLGLSEETLKYLGYVEKNKDALAKMVSHTWKGNYREAGNVLAETVKKEMKAYLESRAQKICLEYMNEAMNAILGDVIPNFGGIFLKIIELEIWAIEAFDKEVTIYYRDFQIYKQRTGEHITRTICEQYRINRGDMRWDPEKAMTENPLGELGAPASLEEILTVRGYAKSTAWDLERAKHDLEVDCYIRSKLTKSYVQSVIQGGKKKGDKLFAEIKGGMERSKEEIRTILTDIRIRTIFDLVVTVVDSKSGEKVSNASVTLNGETKVAPSGVAQFTRDYRILGAEGWTRDTEASLQISASAKDYERKTVQFSPAELQKKFDVKANRIEISIPLDRLKSAPSLFELVITVVDLKTGNPIMNATASVDGEWKDAPKGDVSFQRDDGLLRPEKSQQTIRVSASATGYEPKTVLFTAGLLASKFDKTTNQVHITMALEKSQEIQKPLELLVSVLDSTTGRTVANAIVTVDAEKKQAPMGNASFQRDVGMLLPENSDKNIRVGAEAGGYEPKVLLFRIGDLVAQLDTIKNRIVVSILLDPQKVKKELKRLEVRCDPAEIFEDQASICEAVVYDSFGRGTHVNTRVVWSYRADYGPFVYNGIVRGEEVKKNLGTLPRLIEVTCSFQAMPDEGGKVLIEKSSVLVKPFKGGVLPRINVEKTASPVQIHIGDTVTYGYMVTNTGNCSLQNVKVDDDKCSPVRFVGGDDNNDQQLDIGERWTYECVLKDVQGPTGILSNTGRAEGGDPSGKITVRASATAQISVLQKKVRVPNVVGMIRNDAGEEITKASLKVGRVSQERSYLAVGLVCRQSPEAGTYVDAGTSVDLWITEDEPKYIYVDPPRKTLQLKERVSFDATLITKDGSQKPLDTQTEIRWDPGPGNIFICEKPGKFIVRAEHKGVFGSATITCEEDWSAPVFEPPVSRAGDRDAKVPQAGPGEYTWYAFCDPRSGEVTYGQQLPTGRKIMAGPFPGPRTVYDWIEKNCPRWRCTSDGQCATEPARAPGGAEGWYVLCERRSGSVVLGKNIDPTRYTVMAGPFLGEPDARRWTNQNCSNWRCDSNGVCAKAPARGGEWKVLCGRNDLRIYIGKTYDATKFILVQEGFLGEPDARAWANQNYPNWECTQSGAPVTAPRMGGRWAVVCSKQHGGVSLTQYPDSTRDWIWGQGFFGEPDARRWVDQNCPSWRCDAYGRCLTGVARSKPEDRPLEVPPEPRTEQETRSAMKKEQEKQQKQAPKPPVQPPKKEELSDAEAKALQKELWDKYYQKWKDEWCINRPKRKKGSVNWSGCLEFPLNQLLGLQRTAWGARTRAKQNVVRKLAQCYDKCIMTDTPQPVLDSCIKDCIKQNPMPK